MLEVDGVKFDFTAGLSVSRCDAWAFYRRQVNRIEGAKAVDVIVMTEAGSTAYLIEVKDYRDAPGTLERRARTKPSELSHEVAEKVLHTLGGILAVRTQARDADERGMAGKVCLSERLRVVLHLEQPPGARQIVNPANLQIKLRRLLKAVDPHAIVASERSLGALPWAVA